MNRLWKALLIVLVVCLPACCIFRSARHPEDRQTPAEIMQSETVAMVNWMAPIDIDADGDVVLGEVDPEQREDAVLKAYCAGVWVDDDTFLTAEHCVEDLGKPYEDPGDALLRRLLNMPEPEWDPTGQFASFSMFGDVRDEWKRTIQSSRDAVVVGIDRENDLALVRAVPSTRDDVLPRHLVARVAHDPVRVGDPVYIVGHPSGLWWSFTSGWVSQLRPHFLDADSHYVDAIQVSAPVWFGNSGGGAFNEAGELIGIASWIQKGPNQGFFIDNATIRQFLDHHRIKE